MTTDPQSIGRYTIQRVLGRGAMGVVYLAVDPLLKRPLAIKTLRDAGEEDAAITLERFHREAEISAKLNHPNIITVFDVGTEPQVGPFLAMEYIEGASLSACIRQRLSFDTGMRLMIQAMSALMAAAQAGIIHRDVKPDNMLVSKDGRLKLMDFGIARGNESHLTQAGMVFGTPSYTAPELLVGSEASPATDRYAFAVTTFEVITGILPFQGSSVASTLYKVVHEPPQIPADLEPAVANVFLRALAKDPQSRYQDLQSFMVELAKVLPLTQDQRSKILGMLEGDGLASGSFPVVRTEQLPELPSAPKIVSGSLGSETLVSSDLPLVVPESTASGSGARAAGAPEPSEPKAPSKRLPLIAAGVAAVVVVGGLAAGGWGRLQKAAAPHTHEVKILVEPKGAQIFLNDKLFGVTPMEHAQVPDTGTILVRLPGYEDKDFHLEPDDKLLEYTLEKLSYDISVETDPPGAEVLLNGVSKGQTPLKLEVPKKEEQNLELRLAGYQEWKAKLDKDIPLNGVIRLSPQAFKAAIQSDPPGAQATLDGRSVGRTPLASLQVPATGRHPLKLKLEGYEEWSGFVAKDAPLPKVIALKAKVFRIQVHSEPAGAAVFLEGQKAGTTPCQLEAPVLGSHHLRLSLEGFQEFSTSVDPEHPLPETIKLVALKKAAPAPKPAPPSEKKPGFFRRLFGGGKDKDKGAKPEEKKD